MSEILTVRRKLMTPMKCWHFDTMDENEALAELSEFLNHCCPSANVTAAHAVEKFSLSILDENGCERLVVYFDECVFSTQNHFELDMYRHFRTWEEAMLFVRDVEYFNRYCEVVE
jgi:hypothetical protein